MTAPDYDVVIVGAGVAGAVLADKLASSSQYKILVLESGPQQASLDRLTYVRNFKTSGFPYPQNPPAPKEADFFTTQYAYYVPPDGPNGKRPAQGPVPAGEALGDDPFASTNIINHAVAAQDWFQTNYERRGGGSTWHFLGTSLRLLPNDFRLRSQWRPDIDEAQAQDWPITYDDLQPYYYQAEQAIGVSGPATGEDYLGLWRDPPDYPMQEIPQSYLDNKLIEALQGQSFQDRWAGQSYPMTVSPTPQARNSEANANGRQICKGSSSCIPICPIGAKYDATQHVNSATQNGVTFQYQCVVSQVTPGTDPGSPPIVGIQYKQWTKTDTGYTSTDNTVTARIYVLAAHAIENAKILLNSPWNGGTTVANSSQQVGCNLADHPVSLVYGLADEPLYGYRGPLSTSGIESLRDGEFRAFRGAFRMEIGNDGWTWPTNGPYSELAEPLGQKLYGKALADAVSARLVRQTRIGCLTEQLPNQNFRVTLSSSEKDVLGIPRPQITFGIDEYAQRSLSAAVAASIQVFRCLIKNPVIEYNYNDFTQGGAVVRDEERSDPASMGPPNIFVREGWAGAGHIMGTHRMGADPKSSVVNGNLRAWDHPNLYLLGSGNWPSYGTGNPTLTIAALSLRAADAILAQLKGVSPPDAPIIGTAVLGPKPGEATVSFSAPDHDGGSAITHYTVSTHGFTGPTVSTTDPSQRSLVVPNLVVGEYDFTVTATNQAGISVSSAATNPVKVGQWGRIVICESDYALRPLYHADSVPYMNDVVQWLCNLGPEESPSWNLSWYVQQVPAFDSLSFGLSAVKFNASIVWGGPIPTGNIFDYDAIFLCMDGLDLTADSDIQNDCDRLCSYVQAGGSIYIAGGEKSHLWNNLLNRFGVTFASDPSKDPDQPRQLDSSSHPVLAGVNALETDTGQALVYERGQLPPCTRIIGTATDGTPLVAVVDLDPTTWSA